MFENRKGYKIFEIVFLYVVFTLCTTANAQIITTIAGTGTDGYSGDGVAAISAELFYPAGMAFDTNGNIYFADEINNRIRKINPDGVINTVAGIGSEGYDGDGGMAYAASLTQPTSVAIDNEGNIYIADFGNNCVRIVNKKGLIRTFAGTGKEGYSGDGEQATAAKLYNPIFITFDIEGNLLIADEGNNCIRKVNSTGIITTIAGTGNNGYSGDGGPATKAEISLPTSISVDNYGNIYFTDPVNSCVRKINNNGIISTYAGSGTAGMCGDKGKALAACLNLPWGVIADTKGNLFIADQNNFRVRKVDNNGIITTIAGTFSQGHSGDGSLANTAELNHPWYVAIDKKGNIYVSDWGDNSIRKINFNEGSTLQKKNIYNLYPDPANNLIEIIQNIIEDYTADVTLNDAFGNTVYTGKVDFKSGKAQLQIADIAQGIYVIEITDNKGKTENYRIVIER